MQQKHTFGITLSKRGSNLVNFLENDIHLFIVNCIGTNDDKKDANRERERERET